MMWREPIANKEDKNNMDMDAKPDKEGKTIDLVAKRKR